MKEKVRKNKKTSRNHTLLQKVFPRNKYMGSPRLIRHSEPFLKREELKCRPKKWMMIHRAFYQRDDIDRCCISRKE